MTEAEASHFLEKYESLRILLRGANNSKTHFLNLKIVNKNADLFCEINIQKIEKCYMRFNFLNDCE